MTATIFVLLFAVLIFGLSTLLWSGFGLARVISEPSLKRQRQDLVAGLDYPDTSQVAVLIAAHNEELVIGKTLDSVCAMLPPEQVFVASDGSTDRTAAMVRSYGANVLELNPNRGKAGALAAAVEHFGLDTAFEVVMLLDADTQLGENYFETGLPQFADPEVVAVAGRAKSLLDPAPRSLIGKLLVAYRERLYQVVQVLMKYGQAMPKANVVNIVPGFASMYRARVLPKIDIAAKGLTIEDFNMTFEVHAKKLGRIAFHPSAAVAYTQDPDNLRDYTKQVRRWTLGYWQTIKRHGLHWGKFWIVQALFVMELVTSSLMLLLVVPALLLNLGVTFAIEMLGGVSQTMYQLAGVLPPWAVLLGVLLPDLLLTLFAALMTRRASYLLMFPFFPFLRIVDAWLCMGSLARALGKSSSGVWVSPARRALNEEPIQG
ncbi:glycosyltransferase family 2 protein [Glutamicibacter creatinolyticus]|uniref:glycosyltransferase family 2 protein n=1 Tax=Glutamicibacter creatinolyticus TaxID=162496 RepID=UPI0033E84310